MASAATTRSAWRASRRSAFDFGFTYDFKALHASKWLDGLKVTVGVNNAFNKMPPLAPNAFPNTNADVGT